MSAERNESGNCQRIRLGNGRKQMARKSGLDLGDCVIDISEDRPLWERIGRALRSWRARRAARIATEIPVITWRQVFIIGALIGLLLGLYWVTNVAVGDEAIRQMTGG